jgi:predicted transcriptional regulator
LDNPPPGGNDDAVSTWAADLDQDQVFGEMVNPTSFNLAVAGLQAIELLGAEVSCTGGTCPTGGETSRQSLGGAVLEQWSFERITGLSGTAQMSASPVRVRMGGATLDVEANGAIRLPKAELDGRCECDLEPDSTLTLEGEFALTGLSAGPQGRMNTVLSGDNVAAFSDERLIIIPNLARNAVVTGAGLAAIVIAVKLALGLFTRLTKQEALEHPKRQQIYHYIQEHPGANFREVARNTSIAAGTVRHHLTVLERAGHVVEHQHQGTVRLFENHGKFDHNWSDLVLLREPPLAKLHDWLKAHPGSPQKAALEAMELDGWSRSTTQHRLSRLVEGGVATIRLQGRLKIYNVVDRQAAPKPMAQLIGLRPAFATS